MRDGDTLVPSRYYVRLVELLARSNVDTLRLYEGARICAEAVQKPDALIRFSQADRLIQLAHQQSGRNDLGLELGRALSASTHSIVGFGMLNSPNVERSMQFVARFFRLVMPTFSMRYTKLLQGAEMSWAPVAGMSGPCLAFHIEAIAVAAYRGLQDLSGGALPRFRVELSIPVPPHFERYQELRDARWIFGFGSTPGVRFVFDYDMSQYPLVTADPNALRVAEERCRALASKVAASGNYKAWITMMLREAGEGQPSLTDLAAVLNLSPRTLDRNLKREGSGFRELASQIQHELACERLGNTDFSITAIAHSLGFSDAANFTRSFKARAGCSPREFRERNRAAMS